MFTFFIAYKHTLPINLFSTHSLSPVVAPLMIKYFTLVQYWTLSIHFLNEYILNGKSQLITVYHTRSDESIRDSADFMEQLKRRNWSRAKFGLEPLSPDEFVELEQEVQDLESKQREKLAAKKRQQQQQSQQADSGRKRIDKYVN